jgi:hypothetical protein
LEEAMLWKHLVVPVEENYEQICDGVELLARSARHASDVALFSRTTADRLYRVLLLSPGAVEMAGDKLSANWKPCDCPDVFDWDLVVGSPESYRVLGLRKHRVLREAAATPVTLIGRTCFGGGR